MFFIYSRPLKVIVSWIVLAVLFYAFMEIWFRNQKIWKVVNRLLAVFSILVILYLTVVKREAGDKGVSLTPFITFQLAKIEPELYRSMLMNVFLFVPFGLSFPYLFPEKWKPAGKVLLTVLAGALFSAGIEAAQYYFHLGLTETDDVIMNTAGTVFGAFHLIAAELFIRLHNKRKT